MNEPILFGDLSRQSETQAKELAALPVPVSLRPFFLAATGLCFLTSAILAYLDIKQSELSREV